MAAHKWANEIRAWADGMQIQFKNSSSNGWLDIGQPTWDEDNEYRIKPAEPERAYPVTGMGSAELVGIHDRVLNQVGIGGGRHAAVFAVANAALRHAIDAGQVVTREEFDRMCGDRKARDMAVAEAVRTWAWDRAAGPYEDVRANYDWAVQYRRAIFSSDLAPIIAGVKP